MTLKAGCNERRPSGGQRLGDRGGVLIASTEQLPHFAAQAECLTRFSASIGHISQGGGVAETEGSDLHVIDLYMREVFDEEQELFSTEINVLLYIYAEQPLR